MSEYLIASVAEDTKTDSLSITSLVVTYDGTNSPKIKYYFKSSKGSSSVKNVYFEFENFVFSHQNSTLAFWGKFHFEKLKEMSQKVNGDFLDLFDQDEALNLQFMFKERLNMKRFVGFRDAYTKISGLRFLFSEKDRDFSSIENMANFIPYVLGDKRINRIDLNKK